MSSKTPYNKNLLGLVPIFISKNFVHFSNETKITIQDYQRFRDFEITSYVDRMQKIKQPKKEFKLVSFEEHRNNTIAIRKSITDVTPLGRENPVVALRYVFMKNKKENKYAWYFANGYCSHRDLRDELFEFESELSKKFDGYYVCGGGFYNLIIANANRNLEDIFTDRLPYLHKKPILELFGESDSYPLSREELVAALPFLPNREDVELRIMWENYQFKSDINNTL